MELEEIYNLLDEQVELIRDTSDFYQANQWLAGFVACILRLNTFPDETYLKAILDYKSKILWENFD